MAKDPAMLWYWNDWNGGTITYSRHLKGCYIDILNAQFNSGPLSLEEIKTVLGSDFSAWNTIQKKFSKTSDGLFFNERMEAEKLKRAEYKKHQSKHGKEGANKRWNKNGVTNSNPISNPISESIAFINENDIKGIVDNIGGMGEKEEGKGWISQPKYPDNSFELSEMENGQMIEYVYFMKRKELKSADINQFWKAFQLHSFTGKKYYADKSEVLEHFRNWIKNQKLDESDNKHSGRDAGPKLGTSAARVDSIRKWGIGTTGAGDTRA